MPLYNDTLAPILVHPYPYASPISSLAFDPVSDALWLGSGNGYVSGHYSVRGLRGVCFKAGVAGEAEIEMGRDYPVTKIFADENSIKAGSSGGVGSWAKGGMNKWFYRTKENTMTFSNSSTLTAQSTSSSQLLLINSMTGTLSRQTSVPSLSTHLEFLPQSHVLLTGSVDGCLRMYDSRTALLRGNGESSVVKAHYGSIQGILSSSQYIFSIGMSLRQSRPFPDPLVKVYDVRTMRALPPISFATSPAFLTLVPNSSTTKVAVTSAQGSISIVDASTLDSYEFAQVEDLGLGPGGDSCVITSVAISPTGAYLACGDSDGIVHLKSHVEGDEEELPPLNGFEGRPVEWANPPVPEADASPAIGADWDDLATTPLNSIGLPHYKTTLLSGWTSQFSSHSSSRTSRPFTSQLQSHSSTSTSSPPYPPPQKIPSLVLNTMKTNDSIAYAPLPKELRGKRNVVGRGKNRGPVGRFRSGVGGGGRTGGEGGRGGDENDPDPETPTHDGSESATGEVHVPKIYRHVEIEYSKFGVEDFDFGFYNHTPFSGLETHILNSYTNPLLQVLHYNLPIREYARSHITTDCPREWCLLCELGFVVRMMEDAKGVHPNIPNIQSSNFCRAVGVLAHKSNAIDLVDYGPAQNNQNYTYDYAHMIQAFQRFFFDLVVQEGNTLEGKGEGNPVVVRRPGKVDASSMSTSTSTPAFITNADSESTMTNPNPPQAAPAQGQAFLTPGGPSAPTPPPITQLVGIDATNVVTCLHCKTTRMKENMMHVVDLIYPRTASLLMRSSLPSLPRPFPPRSNQYLKLSSVFTQQFTANVFGKSLVEICRRELKLRMVGFPGWE